MLPSPILGYSPGIATIGLGHGMDSIPSNYTVHAATPTEYIPQGL